jgi:hypothetical protein
MKKVVFGLVTLLTAGVIATTATATGPIASDEGFLCGVLTADGGSALTNESFAIWYASGKTYLRCEADTVNNTGTRVEFSGFPCNVPFSGLTTNSKNSIGYNGRSQLTCIGHADPEAVQAAATGTAGVAG